MKKLFALLLCFLMLTGCTAKQQEATLPPETTNLPEGPIETTQPEVPSETGTTEQTAYALRIYVPDENAESFKTIQINIGILDPNLILQMLIDFSMLNERITMNNVQLDGTQLNLDFNQAFLDQLVLYGTAGEQLMIGCVVNTFLSVYDAETVFITINGEIMESGHVIYDFPMEIFK